MKNLVLISKGYVMNAGVSIGCLESIKLQIDQLARYLKEIFCGDPCFQEDDEVELEQVDDNEEVVEKCELEDHFALYDQLIVFNFPEKFKPRNIS